MSAGIRKAILIYNPVSGDHNIPHRLDQITSRFQEKGVLLQPYRLEEGKGPDLSFVLKDGNYSFAIGAGGDGTLNNIVNVILKSKLDIPMGIIPSGTCNDFARSLNIPFDVNDCIDVILSGITAEVDVGLVNEEYFFLNTCAGGLFVDASFTTHSELKKNFGTFAYYLKAATEVTNIKPFKIEMKTDTATVKEQILIFLILNGKHGAGFSNLVREANVSDGIMDIILIKNCTHIDLAAMFFKVLSNDSLNDRHVMILRSKTCEIKSSNPVPLSIDGERGPDLPISVRFINKAIKVFVPS